MDSIKQNKTFSSNTDIYYVGPEKPQLNLFSKASIPYYQSKLIDKDIFVNLFQYKIKGKHKQLLQPQILYKRISLLSKRNGQGYQAVLCTGTGKHYVVNTVKEDMVSYRQIDFSHLSMLLQLIRSEEIIISEILQSIIATMGCLYKRIGIVEDQAIMNNQYKKIYFDSPSLILDNLRFDYIIDTDSYELSDKLKGNYTELNTKELEYSLLGDDEIIENTYFLKLEEMVEYGVLRVINVSELIGEVNNESSQQAILSDNSQLEDITERMGDVKIEEQKKDEDENGETLYRGSEYVVNDQDIGTAILGDTQDPQSDDKSHDHNQSLDFQQVSEINQIMQISNLYKLKDFKIEQAKKISDNWRKIDRKVIELDTFFIEKNYINGIIFPNAKVVESNFEVYKGMMIVNRQGDVAMKQEEFINRVDSFIKKARNGIPQMGQLRINKLETYNLLTENLKIVGYQQESKFIIWAIMHQGSKLKNFKHLLIKDHYFMFQIWETCKGKGKNSNFSTIL